MSEKYCPICGMKNQFKPYGVNPRENAMCPSCGSLERDRLVWLYLIKKTNVLTNNSKKMLHIAPEKIFQQKFHSQFKDNYLSADLYSNNVMVKMDIQDIQYPDKSFDCMYCSHVLEHVADDKKAMRELFRVLKDDGWAILLVPICNIEKTFEDFSITSPEERTKIFGQADHVRNYGKDYKDRLQNCGWSVDVIYPNYFLDLDEIDNMSITKASGEIYFCTKQIN